MGIRNRKTLKDFFKKGSLPSEEHFVDFIDSTVNKVDDGVTKTAEDGLMLFPIGQSEKLTSFYAAIEDKSPAWSIEVEAGKGSLHFTNAQHEKVMSFSQEMNVGIGTLNPKNKLDVNGTVMSKARKGQLQGKVKADGKWHVVQEGINGCKAFEIIAGVGKKKAGKYALAHVMAISTYGKSRNKLKVTQGYFGTRGNKLQFRWKGGVFDYRLEVRTTSNYIGEYFINYHITELWEDVFMDESTGNEQGE